MEKTVCIRNIGECINKKRLEARCNACSKKHSLEKAIYDSGHYRPINQLPALLFSIMILLLWKSVICNCNIFSLVL